MKEFWDQRYNIESYVYGKDPNAFFKTELDRLIPGRLLLPGEGEGRNAVYAAANGWIIDAFDQSDTGYQKAQMLADEKKVRLNYQVNSIKQFDYKNNYYQAAGLIFIHLPEPERIEFHSRIIDSLKPGGKLILEAFHISQFGKNSGGPQSPAMLYTEDILNNDFRQLDNLNLKVESIELYEGSFHNGNSRVIRCTGIKK